MMISLSHTGNHKGGLRGSSWWIWLNFDNNTSYLYIFFFHYWRQGLLIGLLQRSRGPHLRGLLPSFSPFPPVFLSGGSAVINLPHRCWGLLTLCSTLSISTMTAPLWGPCVSIPLLLYYFSWPAPSPRKVPHWRCFSAVLHHPDEKETRLLASLLFPTSADNGDAQACRIWHRFSGNLKESFAAGHTQVKVGQLWSRMVLLFYVVPQLPVLMNG